MRLNKLTLPLALFPVLSQASTYTYVNCFSSLPSDFSNDDSYTYQSSAYCYQQCNSKGSSYFALYNHNECFCGSSNPSDSESASSSCNAYCSGYDSEMCGGTSSYSVYRIGSDTNSDSVSSSSSNTDTSSSTTSSTTSSTSSTTSSLTSQTSSSSTQAADTSTSESSSSTALQNTLTSSTLTTSSTGSQSQDATSVIYSTAFHTEGGSTIFVTNTITTSAQNSGSATATAGSASTSGKSKHKKANVGAIVGGVVGGVVGAVVIALGILLIVRHVNMKREQDRMEKEYQEAIKPVEYPDKIYASSFSSNHGPPSGSIEEEHTKGPTDTNPFDDSKRISNGTFINGGPAGKNNVLTVVNPDEAD